MFGLFGGSDSGFDEARAALEQNRALYGQIELPEYAEFIPELYTTESATADLVEEDPALRSMQLESLAKFSDLSEQGLSELDEAGFAKARAMGDQIARSKTDAALADAQVRGVAGGGQEFAAREQASQAAAQRAQEAALAEQTARAQQRQQYLQALAQQQSSMRDQDYKANAANTDVINRFNMQNTQNRNATRADNVDQRNSAFKYNEGLKDKRYQNELGRADRIAGINNRGAEISSAEDEQRRRRGAGMMGLIGAGIGAAVAPAGSGATGAMIGSQAGSAFY